MVWFNKCHASERDDGGVRSFGSGFKFHGNGSAGSGFDVCQSFFATLEGRSDFDKRDDFLVVEVIQVKEEEFGTLTHGSFFLVAIVVVASFFILFLLLRDFLSACFSLSVDSALHARHVADAKAGGKDGDFDFLSERSIH